MNVLVSPPFVFAIIWGIVLFLYQLGISSLLTQLMPETIYLIVASCLLFFWGYFVARLRYGVILYVPGKLDLTRYRMIFCDERVSFKIRILFVIWIVGSLAEILYFKNVPLVSALGIGPSVRYTEFGFPVLHGFLNSIYFLLTLCFYIRFHLFGSWVRLFFLMLLFAWPILVLSRMMMISAILQLMFCYLIFARLTIIQSMKLLGLAIMSLFVFGWLGDVRSGREGILRLAQLNFDYPEWAPTFPVWIYVYLVSPINNINHNIFEVSLSGIPINTLGQLLPSPVRDLFSGLFPGSDEIDLVSSGLNVSSIFRPLVLDFGYIFAPFFFFIVGFLAALVVQRASKGPAFLVGWVVLLYTVVQSVFSNHMLHLVFVFEFLFALFVFYRFKFMLGLNLQDSQKVDVT